MWNKNDQYNFDKGARYGFALSMVMSGKTDRRVFDCLESAEDLFESVKSVKTVDEQKAILPAVRQKFEDLINAENSSLFEALFKLSL